MGKRWFYILFCLYSISSNAQERFIAPTKLLSKFHFRQLYGGVMLIYARINDLPDTLHFILDTGSGGISLDSATCVEFHIPHTPSGRTINGLAGIKTVDCSKNNILNLPNLPIKNLDFYVNDYEILSNVYGEKIDGIIGYSFFSRYIVKVNVDSILIEVYQLGEIKYPAHGYLLHPLFTTLPITTLKFTDGKRFSDNFYIDTGAGLSFLLNKEFVTDSNFLNKKRRPVMTQAQGLGGKKQMLLTVIKEVKLGPYTFRKVPTYILDDEFNVTSYPYLVGLIGNDILRRFNLIINYSSREIHLLPNSHFYDPFDYAYSGMSLYAINGKIIIDEIITKSPAEKAGLKKDDIVLGINTNFNNNLTQYNNLIQATSEKMEIFIMRNGKVKLINFKPGRIF